MWLTFVVVAWMASPLLVGLALGTVMGFTAQLLCARLATRFRGRRGLASAATTILGGLLAVGGGVGAAGVVVRKVVEALALVQERIASHSGASLLGPREARLLATLGLNRDVVLTRLRDEVGRAANLAAEAAGLVVQVSTGALLTSVVAMWTMFYVLRDWPRIAGLLERLSPLQPEHTRALVQEFRNVGRRAFVGTVAGAIVQGTIAGIGFALVGLPEPITWAAIMALLTFIPVVGTLLVWVPAAVWLLTSGHVVSALALTAYCLVIVMALNDYVIRPRLIGRGDGAHPLLTLVSILGGISVLWRRRGHRGPRGRLFALRRERAHLPERARLRIHREAGRRGAVTLLYPQKNHCSLPPRLPVNLQASSSGFDDGALRLAVGSSPACRRGGRRRSWPRGRSSPTGTQDGRSGRMRRWACRSGGGDPSSSMSAFGRMSKFAQRMYCSSFSSDTLPVPNVFTCTPTGFATPIA